MTCRERTIAVLSKHLPTLEPVTCHATYVGGPLDGEVDPEFCWHGLFRSGDHIQELEDDLEDGPSEHYLIKPVPTDGLIRVHLIYMGYEA